ncbi:unnamed protein product [Gadus morhua 'NCC']
MSRLTTVASRFMWLFCGCGVYGSKAWCCIPFPQQLRQQGALPYCELDQNHSSEVYALIGMAGTAHVWWKLGDTVPRLLETQEQQQPTYVALSYVNRADSWRRDPKSWIESPRLTLITPRLGIFMIKAARRENQTVRKKSQPKLSLSLSSTGEGLTQSLHTPGTPAARQRQPVTPPMNSSSSFHSSTPTGL